MNGELVPRSTGSRTSQPDRSELAVLSRDVVMSGLARDTYRLPTDCAAKLIAFPAALLSRDDVFEVLVGENDWTVFVGDPPVPTWARTATDSDGCVRLAADERVAVFAGELSGPDLALLLSVLGDRVVFVDTTFDVDALACSNLLNEHPHVVGLRVAVVGDSGEVVQALEALEHLEWLALAIGTTDAPHRATTLDRLSTIHALRHLVLGASYAEDLPALDRLTKLKSLYVPIDKGADWHPQLPALSRLLVGRHDFYSTLFTDVRGCPNLGDCPEFG